MRFKGQLLLPGESGPGLEVNLDVAEHHLAVESDGGGLGAWPLEVVDVERLRGDLFGLTVAGESLRFVADDTIAFAYSGVPAIERVSRRSRNRSGLKSVFGWLRGTDEPARAVVTEAPPADPSPITAVEEPSPPNDDHHEVAGDVSTEALPEATVEDRAMEAVRMPIEPEANTPESPATRCRGIRSDGRRCESQILTDNGYCYPHDPKRAFEDGYEAAMEARAQLKRDATARLNRIYARLDKAMRQVERGELDPDTAMAMAQLARTMCAIVEMDDTPDAKA